jgi:hypothetical protein
VKDYSEGLAPVRVDDRWGYVDLDGDVVIEPRFHDARRFREGHAVVNTAAGKVCLVGRDGAPLSAARYASASDLEDGRAVVSSATRAGLVDATGAVVLPLVYDGLERASRNLYRASRDGKWGYIRSDGSEVIPHRWDRIGKWSRLIPVNRDAVWGYIDRRGAVVVEPSHLAAANMFEGLARVRPADPDDGERYPFLFFGVRPTDWIAEYDEAHLYRLKFRKRPDKRKVEAALAELSAVQWDGAYALIVVEEPSQITDMFARVRAGVERVHRAAPLEEVVAMCARGSWGKDPWDAWTVRRRAEPSDGPLWGRCLLVS